MTKTKWIICENKSIWALRAFVYELEYTNDDDFTTALVHARSILDEKFNVRVSDEENFELLTRSIWPIRWVTITRLSHPGGKDVQGSA